MLRGKRGVGGICLTFHFRYRLSAQEAESVVEKVLKSQIDTSQEHPVSLLDIWTPKGLVPDERELRLRDLAVQEAGKLPEGCSTVDAVLIISAKLRPQGLELCKIDVAWRRLLEKQLRQLEVTSRRSLDINILLSYHGLLWKTGHGWTYQRTPRETNVCSPYLPSIIGVFGDKTDVKTELLGESFWSLDLDSGVHHSLAETIGPHGDWKEIGVLQFFAETLTLGEQLVGPVSQETVAVTVSHATANRWGCSKARPESIDMGEDCWPNVLTQEEFTLTNSMKKLYDIRHDVIEGMPFAQFLTQVRLIKDKGGREYKSITEELGDSNIGPLSSTTLIAGTQEKVPRFMRFRNGAILKLREKMNLIPMLMAEDQVLDNASKVYLFKPWRRPELLLREENLAAIADDDLKACDRIRLELFPESYYCTES